MLEVGEGNERNKRNERTEIGKRKSEKNSQGFSH